MPTDVPFSAAGLGSAARWKGNLLQHAAAVFSRRGADLQSLVYGERAVVDRAGASNGAQVAGRGAARDDGASSDDELFAPRRPDAAQGAVGVSGDHPSTVFTGQDGRTAVVKFDAISCLWRLQRGEQHSRCCTLHCNPLTTTAHMHEMRGRWSPSISASWVAGSDGPDSSRFAPDGTVLASWGDDGAAERLRDRCARLGLRPVTWQCYLAAINECWNLLSAL